jgi:hypothetical protein
MLQQATRMRSESGRPIGSVLAEVILVVSPLSHTLNPKTLNPKPLGHTTENVRLVVSCKGYIASVD